MTKKNPFKKNKYEILYNLINAGVAGLLVLVGSVVDGSITATGVLAAIGAALIVVCIKFQNYWTKQENEYLAKAVTFV